GLFDLGLRNGRLEAVRLTELGAQVLAGAPVPAPRPDAKALIVNPDFEIVVFPEASDPELLYALARFSRRVKGDRVSTVRLSRESVLQAAATGMSADDILETLASRSRTPIPQGVAYNVRDWAKGLRFVEVRTTCLLEAGDAETVERILALPGMDSLAARRVSERVIELSREPEDPALIEELRRLGVFVKRGAERGPEA